MRFQVPQFVDIKDKIVGPFTLTQFMIYLVTGMILLPVYLMSEMGLFMTIALPIVGVAVAFAHVKINGKSLATVLVAGAKFYSENQLHMWYRRQKPTVLKIRDEEWERSISIQAPQLQGQTSLSAMARSLETTGNAVQSENLEDPFEEEA